MAFAAAIFTGACKKLLAGFGKLPIGDISDVSRSLWFRLNLRDAAKASFSLLAAIKAATSFSGCSIKSRNGVCFTGGVILMICRIRT